MTQWVNNMSDNLSESVRLMPCTECKLNCKSNRNITTHKTLNQKSPDKKHSPIANRTMFTTSLFLISVNMLAVQALIAKICIYWYRDLLDVQEDDFIDIQVNIRMDTPSTTQTPNME